MCPGCGPGLCCRRRSREEKLGAPLSLQGVGAASRPRVTEPRAGGMGPSQMGQSPGPEISTAFLSYSSVAGLARIKGVPRNHHPISPPHRRPDSLKSSQKQASKGKTIQAADSCPWVQHPRTLDTASSQVLAAGCVGCTWRVLGIAPSLPGFPSSTDSQC